jgi:hypothetical protein
MEIGDFFGESWERKAKAEKGHEVPDEDRLATPEEELAQYDESPEISTYKNIESQSSFDNNSRELFSQVTRGILDYYRTMTALERVIAADGTNEEVHNADQIRRVAHDSLISTLNAMSRYFGTNGLDNEWRSVIGLERTQVTTWVKKVAPYLILKEEDL